MGKNLLQEPGNLANAEGFIIPARSGLMTVIAADAEVYGLRNISVKPIRIARVRVRWLTTTAFGAAQGLAFEFFKVTGFTAIQPTGSPITVAVHRRRNTGFDAVPATEVTAVIASTAAISGGTFTAPDADEPDIMAVAAGSTLPSIYEDWEPPEGLPMVLDQNEGIVGRVTLTMGATGVGRLYVAVDCCRS